MCGESYSPPTICLLCHMVEEEELSPCICVRLCNLWLKQRSMPVQHNFAHSLKHCQLC